MAIAAVSKFISAILRRMRHAIRRLMGLEADRQEMLSQLERLYAILGSMETRLQATQRQSEHALGFVEDLPKFQTRAEERFAVLREAVADLSRRHDQTAACVDTAADNILVATDRSRELVLAAADRWRELTLASNDRSLELVLAAADRSRESILGSNDQSRELFLLHLNDAKAELELHLAKNEQAAQNLFQALIKQIGDSDAALRAQGNTLLDRTATLHALQDDQGHLRFQVNESLDLIRRMDTNLLHRPIYIQPGLTAVTRLGGWDGHPLAVPTTHAGVLYGHYINGANGEPGVRAVIRDLVRPGDVAIDIGAHVGLHSVIMGFHVGDEGQLICFEPDPELAAALQQTMLLNGYWRRTRTVNAAVADAPGRMAFHRAPHSPESTLFPETEAIERDVIEVEVTSLDTELAPGSRVNFIKMDAEGAEARIFRGMKRVLEENQRISIVMEFAPEHFVRSGEVPEAFLQSCQQSGFEFFAIPEDGSDPVPINAADILAQQTSNLLLRRA